MSSIVARRRYLTNFEPHRLPHQFTDVLVIGSGVAGLRAAIAAAEHADVLMITKDSLFNSSSNWAQGGIAAAMSPEDSPALHAQDTLEVGCGLADATIVNRVVEAAPRHIAELRAWGVHFDGQGDQLALGREGAHSASRILHAEGDATGREMIRGLVEIVRQNPRIRVFENCFAIDLLSENGGVVGAVTFHQKYRHQLFWATTTILASGGVGRVYRETTNPPVATCDGLAMALRAGAVLRDLEMVQFHPTTLYIAGAARALVSEAVRGEGAYLINRAGERFMRQYDARGELAPRDVVSRAIASEMRRLHTPSVYLDVRHFAPGQFAERFPNIAKLCANFDIDPAKDLIPVRPSAHYAVGGVLADADTQTSLAGLLACGEVASTGLHGANRLASNSLLEGLVFGEAAGRLAAERALHHGRRDRPGNVSHLLAPSQRTELDLEDVRHSLQAVMARNVALERSSDRLRETVEIIDFWSRYTLDKVFDEPVAWETQNLLTVAMLITRSAEMRTESRGVHYRSDYPEPDPAWRRHVDVRRAEDDIQFSTSPVE